MIARMEAWLRGLSMSEACLAFLVENLCFYPRIWDRLFGTLAEGKGGPGTS